MLVHHSVTKYYRVNIDSLFIYGKYIILLKHVKSNCTHGNDAPQEGKLPPFACTSLRLDRTTTDYSQERIE